MKSLNLAPKDIKLNFPLYFSKKIALSKGNKNNLSRVIVLIGQISVALGIIISLLTVSIGYGSKNAIKQHLSDFNGHLNIKSKRTNTSYESSPIDQAGLKLSEIQKLPTVAHVQKFVTVTGIMRTKKDFAGIIFKGIGKDFDHERFRKFLVAGKEPEVTEEGFNGNVAISQKIANDLGLKVSDSIVTIFAKDQNQPIYRKFRVSGIYKTDIKVIDEQFVIGGINHARKISGMKRDEVGGYDVFFRDMDAIQKNAPSVDRLVGLKNYTETVVEKFPQIVDMIGIFDNNIAVIIVIMLVVVIINIVMVLLILIIERTNSIGLLKTIGATNFSIQKIFIYYTLMIMVPGLIIGNLVGLGLLILQRYTGLITLNPDNYYISTVPVDLNPLIPLLLSLGILAVSAISMILPSYIISKISPVKSIRYA